MVVPLWGSISKSYKGDPKRNYHGAYGFGVSKLLEMGEDLLVDTYHFTAVGIASLTDGLFFASSRRGPCLQ